jgi:hypothetical protein
MKDRVALTAAIALAAGLAACSSSSSGGTATASTASASGTETIYGKVTGPAALASNPVVHLTFTGPVATTATQALGASAPKKGGSFTFHTAVGDLTITYGSFGAPSGTISARTCLDVVTETVPIAVDGAKSTGKFAGAAGTGNVLVKGSGNLPKLRNGKCQESPNAQLSPKTAVATFTATIKLTVKQ